MDDAATSAKSPMPTVAPDPELAADPHALTVLTTEHWSLLSAQGHAYNESFTRTNMYLTFISLSFVALALLAQAMTVGHDFLLLAAVVLGFDFIIGILTSMRVIGAALEDSRATQAMNRIRHGYVRIAPCVAPYLTTGVHDDLPGIVRTYAMADDSTVGGLGYALSTSGAVVGLITSVVGGAGAAVVVMLLDLPVSPLLIGVVTSIVSIVVGMWLAFRTVAAHDARLTVRFPTPTNGAATRGIATDAKPDPRSAVGTDDPDDS